MNLPINEALVNEARANARSIAEDTQLFIEQHTTVTVERSIARLLGVDSVDENGVPLPNRLIDHLLERGLLPNGVAYALGAAILATGETAQNIAARVAEGTLTLSVTDFSRADILSAVTPLAEVASRNIAQNRLHREQTLERVGDKTGPLLYVIVATGNIYEDITQATAAAKQGADVVAVIRTTGQSLLDYVPFGATTEGFGGTYATQENFRLMRSALDEAGNELGRYIRLCNYCSGLCMPEIAAMGAMERLDVMLNDALYGILFRDINPERTLVDQAFSRRINAKAGIIINTGEDNYLTTADAMEEAHTVLASQFLNEQLAVLSGLPPEQMGLGHAFEIDPLAPNGFLFELAQAQLARQIFPDAPLKYMPPTKFMTGNIFRGHVQDALFNMVTVLTHQRIHLLGMLTEAIHTPYMSDRALAIENARYIQTTMRDLGDELTVKPHGIMETRANEVLEKAAALLSQMAQTSLFQALSEGTFAGIARRRDGGKGRAGVVMKSAVYENPFETLWKGGAPL